VTDAAQALGVSLVGTRIPVLGEVDWPRFVAALYAVGYDHVVSVEHEDRRFEGTQELVERGFLIARNTLAPLLV
jgi:sugar phosphate isomerase/epimerase